MKERSPLETEDSLLGPEDVGARQVGRQQVGRELQALEVRIERGAQRFDRSGLGKSRRSLDEQMAIGEQRDQQSLDQRHLSDDLAGQVFPQAQEGAMCGAAGAVRLRGQGTQASSHRGYPHCV